MSTVEIFGMETLGRVLREHRNARGWSLDVAAGKLRITPASLGMYERGDRNPQMGTVVDVLALYGLSLVVVDQSSTAARVAALRAELAQLERVT